MKHYRIFLTIAVLVLASLACLAGIGERDSGNNNAPNSENSSTQPDTSQPTEASTASVKSNSNSSDTVNTEFPMTDDAFNITELDAGSLLYYTKLSAEDAMQFYRDAYTAKGYTERKVATTVSNSTFSIIFDGDPSGNAIVVQSVDMGDGTRTITVRLEDI
jgi:hypothetical protein